MTSLIITRKLGESFIIGDDVVVTVVSRNAKQVRLKIEAPEHVTVLRAELQDLDEPVPLNDRGTAEIRPEWG